MNLRPLVPENSARASAAKRPRPSPLAPPAAPASRAGNKAQGRAKMIIAANGLKAGADLRRKRGDGVGVAGPYAPVQL